MDGFMISGSDETGEEHERLLGCVEQEEMRDVQTYYVSPSLMISLGRGSSKELMPKGPTHSDCG